MINKQFFTLYQEILLGKETPIIFEKDASVKSKKRISKRGYLKKKKMCSFKEAPPVQVEARELFMYNHDNYFLYHQVIQNDL